MQSRSNHLLACSAILSSGLLLTGCLTSRSQLRADGGYDENEPIVAKANIQRVETKGGYALDEVKQELTRMTGRLDDMERSGAQANNADLAAQKESLKKIEERLIDFENAQMLVIERLQKLEGQQQSAPAKSEGTASNVNEFQKGKALYEVGDFEGAVVSFGDYLQSGKTKFLEEATFLRAEANFTLKQYKKAIADYATFPEKFSRSRYMPTALYKIGMGFLALNQKEDAQSFFQMLLDKFPKSPEAKKAREKLK